MKIRILLTFILITSYSLFAADESIDSVQKSSSTKSLYTGEIHEKEQNKRIDDSEKRIKDYVSAIEKIQPEIVKFEPKFQKQAINIVQNSPGNMEASIPIDIYKILTIKFDGSKVKEFELYQYRRNVNNSFNNIKTTINFVPTSKDTIKITQQYFAADMKEGKPDSLTKTIEFKDLQTDAKLATIKMVEGVLLRTVYKFDGLQSKFKTLQKEDVDRILGGL
jgi:hypothetical protein